MVVLSKHYLEVTINTKKEKIKHSHNTEPALCQKGHKYIKTTSDTLKPKSGVFIITVSFSVETNRNYVAWDLTRYWMRW